MSEQTILHKGEELGQSRELKANEVLAYTLISGIKAAAVSVGAIALVSGGRLLWGEDVSLPSILVTGSGVFAVSLAVHILGDLDTLIDGLRSFRSVESYAPSQPGPLPEPWRPPIPVVRRGDVSLLDMNEDPRPSLPAAPEQPVLTPASILEILQAALERDGSFSRRTITRLRLSDGRKVSRSMWQEAATWLHRFGVLRQDKQGGYCLPNEVRSLDDLLTTLPGLGRWAGLGREADWAGDGGDQPDPADRGRELTLAERHRLSRMADLEHSVRCYLERKDHHG